MSKTTLCFVFYLVTATSFFSYEMAFAQKSSEENHTNALPLNETGVFDPRAPLYSRICPTTLEDLESLRLHIKNFTLTRQGVVSEVLNIAQCLLNAPSTSPLRSLKAQGCLKNFMTLNAFINLVDDPRMEQEKIDESSLMPGTLKTRQAMMDLKLLSSFPPEARAKALENYFLQNFGKLDNFKIYQFQSKFQPIHGSDFVVISYTSPLGLHILNIDLNHRDSQQAGIVNGTVYSHDSSKAPYFFSFRPDFATMDDDIQKSKAPKYELFTSKALAVSCNSCHISGYIPIVPKEDVPEIVELNAKMKRQSVSRLGQYIEQSGMPLFADMSSRSDQQIQELLSFCMGDSYQSHRFPLLKKALNCASCHDGSKSAPLNDPFYVVADDTITKHAVEILSMPQNVKINAKEKELLYKCLVTEFLGSPEAFISDQIKSPPYRGRFIEWLTEASCL